LSIGDPEWSYSYTPVTHLEEDLNMITLNIKEAITSSKAWIRERKGREPGTLCITVLLRDKQQDASIVFWVGAKAASKLVARLHAVPSRMIRIN
jgi:hypothetical protein